MYQPGKKAGFLFFGQHGAQTQGGVMKNEEELGHYCVNPNTCGICNGIVKFEDLRDPMPALVIQVEEDEFPGVCNLAPLKGGYVIK